ncbi:MAG: lipopolysaccharide biosynthesis protein [Acidobacteriia bacterium]|nr:lipopolysaccharide biosynthesis protein [Terriglobia bacterium]
MLWNSRRALVRTTVAGFLISTLVAFLIPASYTSTAQLMPPDTQSSSGIAMITALAKAGGGLGSMTGDLLGLKSTGALFVGMLRSETSQAKLVQQFDLKNVYSVKLIQDARATLDERTMISEDRKSGIITISVTDRSPQRAAALANAYVDELNSLVTDLSTSSAHRERVFLEDRLTVAKQDLDEASSDFAQFSSKNSTLDIQQMGKAMLDAAGNIAGQLIAAESELQGLRQIYTDDNARVQSLSARVAELRKQLARLQGGRGNAGDRVGPNVQAASLLPTRSTDVPYPSIRSLPLLGVKYGDYYRRSKIQETVYELLTEQYELAKIQEAKETPSVKVLDGAKIPEKRSFPPRMMFIVLGTFVVFASCLVWVGGTSSWRATDPQDPRKLLVQEAVGAVKARMSWVSRNGHKSDD